MSLQARFFNSEGKVTKLFNVAGDSLNLPTLNQTPFRLTVRKDVVVAIIAALIHSGKLTVLLDYVVSLSMEQSLKPALLHHGDFLNQRGHKDPPPQAGTSFQDQFTYFQQQRAHSFLEQSLPLTYIYNEKAENLL